MEKIIVHLDMDAFYASVEQADNPALAGLPVIIGQGMRGVVSAASYEARKFGVHSAMPVVEARRRCPDGVFLRGRMERYKEVSRAIMEILSRYSPVVEQASIDEAYMDISGTTHIFGPPAQLARALKSEILEATGLRCSVGIAPTKYLAKIVSDWNKPDGLYILLPEDVPGFMVQLPVAKMPGVGKKFQEELRAIGVLCAGDVLRYDEAWWENHFGKRGVALHRRSRGKDGSEVTPTREAKSTSCERTFEQDISDPRLLKKYLMDESERVGADLRKMGVTARTITLKLKFNDFTVITRSYTLKEPTSATNLIYRTVTRLLAQVKLTRPVRLIGVGASGLGRDTQQLSLFASPSERDGKLDRALDSLRKKHGKGVVTRGPSMEE